MGTSLRFAYSGAISGDFVGRGTRLVFSGGPTKLVCRRVPPSESARRKDRPCTPYPQSLQKWLRSKQIERKFPCQKIQKIFRFFGGPNFGSFLEVSGKVFPPYFANLRCENAPGPREDPEMWHYPDYTEILPKKVAKMRKLATFVETDGFFREKGHKCTQKA